MKTFKKGALYLVSQQKRKNYLAYNPFKNKPCAI